MKIHKNYLISIFSSVSDFQLRF